jgi:sterol desaturase/sphingolipid hydroxylase (fatty acid hydroxylase superfamily)
MNPSVFLAVSGAVFVVAIVEALAARAMGKKVHTFEVTLSNVGAVLGNVAVAVVLHVGPFLGYAAAAEHAPWQLPADSVWTFALALVGLDLLFYAQHRASHRIRALWVVHQVHHSAEDFNVSVAMRAPWGQALLSTIWLLPLALSGVPASTFGVAYAVFMLWGPLVHTRLVGKLGWLEYVFVTPSNHRVHHGSDEKYLDSNYASMFAVIDVIFGTFVLEEEEPTYGLTVPVKRKDALSVQIDPVVDLARDVLWAPTPADAVRFLVMPPGWAPASTRKPASGWKPGATTRPTQAQRRAALGAFAAATLATLVLVVENTTLDLLPRVALTAIVMGFLWLAGAFASGRRLEIA